MSTLWQRIHIRLIYTSLIRGCEDDRHRNCYVNLILNNTLSQYWHTSEDDAFCWPSHQLELLSSKRIVDSRLQYTFIFLTPSYRLCNNWSIHFLFSADVLFVSKRPKLNLSTIPNLASKSMDMYTTWSRVMSINAIFWYFVIRVSLTRELLVRIYLGNNRDMAFIQETIGEENQYHCVAKLQTVHYIDAYPDLHAILGYDVS